MGRNLPLGFNCNVNWHLHLRGFFFWQLCWFAEHGYFRVRWLTTVWLGVVQRKDWVNTRLVDRLIDKLIPGTSHHHFRTTNQAAIWNTLFVSICERKDWAVIYFDAVVNRCRTDRNVHISTDEFRKKETKWGDIRLMDFPLSIWCSTHIQ